MDGLTYLTDAARQHMNENHEKESAMLALQLAVGRCVRAGVVPTIETVPVQPLAMRNYVLVVDAREVR